MGISALNIAIENAFATSWSSTTVRYDNNPFTIPSGNSWVSLSVWPGKSSKNSIGTGVQLRRTVGTVFIDVYTPINGGVKPAADLVDSITAIFRDLVVSGITFYEGSTSRINEKYFSNSGSGVSTTTQWYQMSVSIPFKYDEYL